MSRVWSSGFELQSVTPLVEFTANSGAATIDTVTVHGNSVASGRFHPVAATGAGVGFTFSSTDLTTRHFARGYFYIANLPSGISGAIAGGNSDVTILGFENSGGFWCEVTLDASGVVRLYEDGSSRAVIGTSAALSTAAWHRIELGYESTASYIELLIDGVSIGSTTSAPGLGGISQVSYGIGIATGETSSADVYWDDLAVNNTSGSFQNSWPGAGSIIHLQPNAAGDNNGFVTQVGGTAGAANNYTRVSEVTPDDVTSYNADVTSGHIDDFNLSATPSGLTAGDTINVAAVGVRFGAPGASAVAAFKVRLKKTTAGTVSSSTAITPITSTWRSNATAVPRNYPLTLYQDPDSVNWTKSTLDSAQVGYTISTTNTNAARISTIWLLVESTTASDITINVSDSSSLSESLGQVLTSLINDSDSLTTTEYLDIIRANARDITVSDASSLSESQLLSDNDNPAILDNIAHSESLQLELNSYASPSDSSSHTESLGLLETVSVNVSDSLTTAESISQYLNAFFINVSDNSPISDNNFSLSTTSFITVSDSLTTTENLSFLDSDIDSVSDTTATTESIKLTLVDNVNTTTNLTAAENISLYIDSFFITISDSTSVSENVSLLLQNLIINIANSLTVSDSNLNLNFGDENINVSDAATTNENVSPLVSVTVSKSDTAATTESFTVSLVTPGLPTISTSENLTTTENILLVTSDLAINVSDSTTLAESVGFLDIDLKTVSDSSSTSENLKLLSEANVALSDSSSLSENVVIPAIVINLAVSDSLVTAENISLLDSDIDNVSDTLTMAENRNLTLVSLINVNDTATATENVVIPALDENITVSDSTATTENVTFAEAETINISNSLAMTENLSLMATPNLNVANNLTTTFNVSLSIDLNISLADNLSHSESLAVAIPGAGTDIVVVADNLAIGENLSLFIPTLNINTNDTITHSELISVVGKTAFINVSDSISTIDVASAGSIGIKVSDTISHTESVSIHIQARIQKSYLYKISRNNKFLGILQNVTSEFGYAQDINTGGSQCNITVALSADTQDQAVTPLQDELGNTLTDEAGNPLLIERQPDIIGNDNDNILMRNDNDIQVFEFSDYWPNGKLMFSGYISTVQAMFGADDGDVINLTALSDGSEVSEYLIESGTNNDQTQLFQNAFDTLRGVVTKSGGYNEDGQSFTVGGGVTNISGIVVKLQGSGSPQNVEVSLFDAPNGNLLASVNQTINSNAIADYTFTFTSAVPDTAGRVYFFSVAQTDPNDFVGVNIFYQGNDIYGSGNMYSNNYGGASGGTFTVTPAGTIPNPSDLYFKTLTTTNVTEAAYTGFDPTDILKDIMLNYNNKGGRVTLDPNITETGLGANYTFNVNSVAEGINTLLSLAPNGWYWYIDVATKVLYFQPTSTTATYKFIRGRHLSSLQLKSTIDNLKNVVYFSGGNPGGGNVYVKYTNTDSLAANNNRVGMDRISDSNVLDTTTGLVLAKDDSNQHMSEEYQTQISIIDTTMDITLPHVGDTIGFEGYGSFVDKLVLQITRITYTPDVLTITVGTLPRRVHKDIQKLKDQLIALQVQNNTASPTPF